MAIEPAILILPIDAVRRAEPERRVLVLFHTDAPLRPGLQAPGLSGQVSGKRPELRKPAESVPEVSIVHDGPSNYLQGGQVLLHRTASGHQAGPLQDAIGPVAVVSIGGMVQEGALKMLCTPAPVQAQVPHEEGCAALPMQVRDPACGSKFSHSCIHEGESSLALLPLLKQVPVLPPLEPNSSERSPEMEDLRSPGQQGEAQEVPKDELLINPRGTVALSLQTLVGPYLTDDLPSR
mmetsp:Transcript_48300/g.105119  ORF Transcript_48300/g.105119 Transcript_48300/m.105119 type:complete len:236 (+) Transcript_48300:101-808(+)